MFIYVIVKLLVMIVLGMDFGVFLLGMVVFIINSSVYVFEIFRVGILFIEKG